ncbi:MAG TPA: hypothetical protein VLW83_06465 [Candidatus Acidoferrales bacterium]|nr:hypothetical protein [Candidatus Acidoferrales bacterium]
MTPGENLRPAFDRLQRGMLIAGLAALTTTFGFYARNPDQFFRSYLLAFVFWIGFPLGSMAILMLNHLTGGDWGLPIRRPLEAATRTFPAILILFIPLLLGLKTLYPWMRPEVVTGDAVLRAKAFYLNPSFFLTRAAIYFVIWFGLSYVLNKWSEEQDRTGDPALAKRLEGLSGPGLIFYGLTVTYASIDWVMSLEPHWYSTIFGMIFMMIGVLCAMAMVIIVASLLARHEPFASMVVPAQFNDLGNLLLTFVMLWAYLSFSQWLIIWSGNLRDEIPWYMTRARGAWEGWGLFLIIFHFSVPFLLLLQRGLKRRVRALAWIAAALLVTDFMVVIWMVVPAFEPNRVHIHPQDLTAMCGIGGIWVAAFVWQLKRRPLLPLHAAQAEGVAQHGD